ncbi:stage III sporulation protein AA [Scopulibacillus darangshiensis]|uniref:Stage III sporulation protein AA n=1 Tax=Scopulibacillus darangshiensis TaxID=442528 RepID=A0A4R2P8B5_9BACL|nr:stage III sporulation protein AA [Scopulibacillus darangshiensis]TCP31173.1 stage III sporulation protein AA [Scopulibacillus darangshiensis]
MKEILRILPASAMGYIQSIPRTEHENIEEIRLRVGRQIEIVMNGRPYPRIQENQDASFSQKDAQSFIHKLSEYSLYALEEELRRGFITISGGHRVGLSGHVVTRGGQVKLIRDISSFNIRIAKQKIGAALPLVPYLFEGGHWYNTLIIGSPQTGKTTLLRDLSRLISSGIPEQSILSKKVGIVDERSEIAGSLRGVPQNELGQRVDVLDACPKAEGMMMLIRSMSPDVLVVDEIGRKEDSDALQEAMNAGVAVMATVHSAGYQQLFKRPTISPLLETGVFERYVELSNRAGQGHNGRINRILDGQGKVVHRTGKMTS